MQALQQKLKEMSLSLVESVRAIIWGGFFSTSLQTQLSILQILRNLFLRIGMMDNRLRIQDFSHQKITEIVGDYLKAVDQRMSNISLLEQKVVDHLQVLMRHLDVGDDGAQVGAEPNRREAQLIEFLFPWLADKTVIDVGAHRGKFFEAMLAIGFNRVFAFEPNSELAKFLVEAHQANTSVRIFPYAVSDRDREGELYLAKAHPEFTEDPLLFSTLQPHPMGLEFDRKIPVEILSLGSLIREGMAPARAGLLKIDTEGADFSVLQGMPADCQYEIIVYKFWSKGHVFNCPEFPQQEEMVRYLRNIGYGFSISLIYLPNGKMKFVANMPTQIPGVWGNTFCFRDSALFEKAYSFIRALIPQTV